MSELQDFIPQVSDTRRSFLVFHYSVTHFYCIRYPVHRNIFISLVYRTSIRSLSGEFKKFKNREREDHLSESVPLHDRDGAEFNLELSNEEKRGRERERERENREEIKIKQDRIRDCPVEFTFEPLSKPVARRLGFLFRWHEHNGAREAI